MGKNPPAVPETQAETVSEQDPLEGEMAPHSSVLAWRIPWTQDPGNVQVMGLQRVRYN